MPDDEKKIAVIKQIFRKANKQYVCPGCHKSYARFRLLTDHLSRELDKKHEGLMAEQESIFYSCYRRLIGWEDADNELILPPDRAAAFEIDFFAQHRLLKPPPLMGSKMQSLLDIAVASGMKYVCPQCLENDFGYFNTMTEMRDHCWREGDPRHMGLISTDPGTFFPIYLKVMNRCKVENLADPFSGRSRAGPRSFHLYLRIGYVFQERV